MSAFSRIWLSCLRPAPVTSAAVMAALNCASCCGRRFRYSQKSRPSLCSSKGTLSCRKPAQDSRFSHGLADLHAPWMPPSGDFL